MIILRFLHFKIFGFTFSARRSKELVPRLAQVIREQHFGEIIFIIKIKILMEVKKIIYI